MKIIKIFLPKNLLNTKTYTYLYGNLQIEDNEVIKFYVIKYSTKCKKQSEKLKCIGIIRHEDEVQQRIEMTEEHIEFSFNDKSSNIVIEKLVTFPGFDNNPHNLERNIQLILYDTVGFDNLSRNKIPSNEITSHHELLQLARLIKLRNNYPESYLANRIVEMRAFFYRQFFNLLSILSFILQPCRFIFKRTAVYRHSLDWVKCVQTYNFANGTSWTLLFDVTAGIIILALVVAFGNPGRYFMHFTEVVVYNLRQLLETLRGSPVGLKLNVLLNNFFLDCFIYHVELWYTFLTTVSSAIYVLFIPLTVFGLFGLSFQLAMLSDLLILISLHAHCFYIYAAVLYRMEVIGLRGLLRVLLGRKKNILRSRLESHDYMNRQLYLATITFSALLFLLPTVLVYYVVFASLRFAIYCICYIIMTVRRNILIFPIYTLSRWLRGVYVNADCLELQILDSQMYENDVVAVIYVNPKPAAPWVKSLFEVNIEKNSEEPVSIGNFFSGLIQGEMMGFIQPDEKIS